MEPEPAPTIRDLFPELDESDLGIAEDNFDRYLALTLRIFDRINAESCPQSVHLTGRGGTLGCTLPPDKPSKTEP